MNYSAIFVNYIELASPKLFLSTSVLILIINGVILAVDKQNNYSHINKSILWLSIVTLILSYLIILNNPLTNSIFSLTIQAMFNLKGNITQLVVYLLCT
jgi:hypothetical protein